MTLAQALAIAAASLTLVVEPASLLERVEASTDAALTRAALDARWAIQDMRSQLAGRLADPCAAPQFDA